MFPVFYVFTYVLTIRIKTGIVYTQRPKAAISDKKLISGNCDVSRTKCKVSSRLALLLVTPERKPSSVNALGFCIFR